ncbi:MAG: branched-chain amino acid ABC transporter permease [Rhodocyclaceae bacterium]|nr:MAG: branched-chain amino acid ABC transporter permease [Rhodocyclaceae bacterium]
MNEVVPPLLHRRRLYLWGALALVMIVLPLVFNKGFALSLMCQISIMVIFSLSYNMLLGNTGLLSFGHAVYFGTGAFATMHALNLLGKAGMPLPVSLLPLIGGMAGLLGGLLFGYVSTKRAGTTLAMISLGIGELVASASLMFPAVFGGEGGVSGNRVIGKAVFGVTFGPQIEMYYLIAAWAFVSIVAMFALTQTPLGRMANAVRDNPERAQFVGYDPEWVRYMMMILAGFFAGIAGGLSALNYEMVTAETLGAWTSGVVLLMSFVGGIGFFYGPIIGAVLISMLAIGVAGVTKAWLFYFGLFFLTMVLYAPGGIASLLTMHKRLWNAGQLLKVMPAYAVVALPLLLTFGGVVSLVEMAYHHAEGVDTPLQMFGAAIDVESAASWLAAMVGLAAGLFLLKLTWRRVSEAWRQVLAGLEGKGAA